MQTEAKFEAPARRKMALGGNGKVLSCTCTCPPISCRFSRIFIFQRVIEKCIRTYFSYDQSIIVIWVSYYIKQSFSYLCRYKLLEVWVRLPASPPPSRKLLKRNSSRRISIGMSTSLFLASTVSEMHRNAHIWNASHPLVVPYYCWVTVYSPSMKAKKIIHISDAGNRTTNPRPGTQASDHFATARSVEDETWNAELVLNGGEILVNCKFKFNKNLILNLYREIPRNSNPIKISIWLRYRDIRFSRFWDTKIFDFLDFGEIPRYLIFSILTSWLKSP